MYADRSGVDQFITEIAEPRVELDTVGLDITPAPEDYAKAVEKIISYVEGKRFTGIARFTEALRIEYYKLVNRILQENDQAIDCYAGWSSAQIYSDGTVWPCCVRADNLGNLRDRKYDFKEIWFGEDIKRVRRSIAAKECHCTLASASYTNLLEDIPTLARLSGQLAITALRSGSAPTARPQKAIAEEGSSEGDRLAPCSSGRRASSMAFEWLNRFQHRTEKKPTYVQETLAAYALGTKAGGPLTGVVVRRGPESCDAARALPAGMVYAPGDAPHLPLPDCSRGRQCDCVYRPAMIYEQADGQDIHCR